MKSSLIERATALLNEKDVVLVDVSESAADARATVRALRELTDKPSGSSSFEPAQAAGRRTGVFREV